MTSVPRAALYVRVSSSAQAGEDRYSLPTQEEACRAYCEERGFVVVQVYREIASASHYRWREQLSALRAAARDGAFDVVVVHTLDRLSRDQVHLAILIEEFREAGVELHCVLEPVENSAVGRFLALSRAFAAELERERLVERTQRGRRARAERGKPIIGPKPPYGVRWDEDAGRFVEDPHEADVVRFIFRRAAEGASLYQIAAELTERGIPTPMGKAIWKTSTVRYLLRDERYTGKAYAYLYKTERRANGKYYRTAVPDDWRVELPAGVMPQIVPHDLFEAVQARLEANQREARRSAKEPERFLLRGGVARCGKCGRPLHALLRRVNGRVYPYYRCSGRGEPRFQRCSTVNMRQEKLDAMVWDAVRDAVLDERVVEFVRQQFLEAFDEHEDDLSAVERTLAAACEEEDTLVRNLALIRDPGVAARVAEELERVHQRRLQLEAERQELIAQRDRRKAWQERVMTTVEWLRTLRARLDAIDVPTRRELLRALGVQVTLHPKDHEPRVVIEAAIPLQLATCDKQDKQCCLPKELGARAAVPSSK